MNGSGDIDRHNYGIHTASLVIRNGTFDKFLPKAAFRAGEPYDGTILIQREKVTKVNLPYIADISTLSNAGENCRFGSAYLDTVFVGNKA
jgi:hypothetical protein